MEFIDTHAHIYSSEFNADRDIVIQKIIKSGVSKVILPAIDSQSHFALLELAGKYPDLLLPLMGLHPTSVNDNYKEELLRVEQYIAKGSLFRGIGEIGIDLYWDRAHFKEQQDAFVTQVKWAKELGLPVVIHTRDSFYECYELLEPLVDDGLKGVFHCFGGTLKQANLIIQLGFKLGIGGVVTFKNSKLSDVLKQVSLNHIVLETDSPYLAPVPYRGMRNDSSYLSLIAEKLAEINGTSLEHVAEITTKNAKELFAIKS